MFDQLNKLDKVKSQRSLDNALVSDYLDFENNNKLNFNNFKERYFLIWSRTQNTVNTRGCRSNYNLEDNNISNLSYDEFINKFF